MTLVKYIFKRFVPLFLGSLFFFAFVLILVDLLMNLWPFIQNQVPPATVFRLMALYVPKTIWYSTPIATLFAVAYTLSDFYANNELTAIFASGVPLAVFAAPLLIFAFLASFALFFFDDRIVVPTYAKKTTEQEVVLNKQKKLNNDNIVVLSDFGSIIYKADHYDDNSQRLEEVCIVVRNADKTLYAVIRSISAVWRNEKWMLSSPTQYTVSEDGIESGWPEESLLDRLNEPPETFRNNTVSVETVNVREAREYIEHLRRTGLPVGEAQSVYYKKFSFPFILFIVVFLSVGLSGKTRKNVLLTSLASCITAAVLFYVTQMITMLLAKFGYISPFMGAWFPVFLFVIISVILLKYART